MTAQRSKDVADRLRWGLIPLAVLIGVTAYVASDDVGVSIALSAALGLTALGSAWLLLRGWRGGSVLPGVSAVRAQPRACAHGLSGLRRGAERCM